MFLPGRMSFMFNMEDNFSHDIPTVLHRSKADCPVPEEMVTVGVDGSVLEIISKIMSYLRLGSSGKVLKKKKKDKDSKVKLSAVSNDYDEDEKPAKPNGSISKLLQKERFCHHRLHAGAHLRQRKSSPLLLLELQRRTYLSGGVDYSIPSKDMSQSPPVSDDMEESPRNRDKQSYFNEPVYGPVRLLNLLRLGNN
ncbi:suppressor of mec-8 and unc-52 protein-like protein 2 [Iris pallida]|uniref:Suppressor of mec-8 and unc-52 protein-like protein 2 n=1 Tax=Iris pallida TaxID=29817 RepID=A0AAX6IL12_IRIPA|nr:suppressor of mec-8 and unc-52 protein-like protein 2 [Iris pallida]